MDDYTILCHARGCGEQIGIQRAACARCGKEGIRCDTPDGERLCDSKHLTAVTELDDDGAETTDIVVICHDAHGALICDDCT